MSTTRDLIHDTHASSVADERKNGVVFDDTRANSLYISSEDFKELGVLFKWLRERLIVKRKQLGFHFNGNEYSYIHDQCRILISESDTDGITYVKAELTFMRNSDSDQRWIRVTYSLYHHNSAGPVLAFIGNPTTIVSGSNIRPIRIDDVSRFQETLYFYKLGFLLPAYMFADKTAFKWTAKTAKKIQRGEINVSNTQWALYLPSEDKKIDMVLLAGLYCGRSVAQKQSMSLAEYLGFESATTAKGKDGKLSGVFLIKKRGKNHVLTINFYDKRQSVSNKKQGKSLSSEEIKLIDSSLRLDITAHSAFLQSIVSAAKKHAKKLIEINPQLENKLDRFLLTKPNAPITAYLICRAMSILAIQSSKDRYNNKVLYKGSFTSWLLTRVLEDELHLMSILKYGGSYLHAEARDEKHNAILKTWRSDHEDIVETILKQKEFKEYSTAWVYKQRKEIIEQYGIDIFVPYNYWIELSHLNQAYGLSLTERGLLYEARFNPGLSDQKVVNIVRKLSKKSSKKFNIGTRKLLASLQMVAQQIKADKLDVRALTDK